MSKSNGKEQIEIRYCTECKIYVNAKWCPKCWKWCLKPSEIENGED